MAWLGYSCLAATVVLILAAIAVEWKAGGYGTSNERKRLIRILGLVVLIIGLCLGLTIIYYMHGPLIATAP